MTELKLQKVYKSFHTIRKLADYAILINQSWYIYLLNIDNFNCTQISCVLISSFVLIIYRWKLLDFAELKRSSISFFDIEKHETAISRWSRARTRAAKVGKGLSKDVKARKLALLHWLEAVSQTLDHTISLYSCKFICLHSYQSLFTEML
jgi:hypothetical protein